jgi:hypothetical protein
LTQPNRSKEEEERIERMRDQRRQMMLSGLLEKGGASTIND